MKKKMFVILIAVMCTLVSPFSEIGSCVGQETVEAATKRVFMSSTKKTVEVGKTFTLKLKNATTSKVKWKSSNTSIASVSSKGTVKAKKSGKVTIIAKYLKKNYKCIVTVTNAKDDGEASAEEVSPQYNNYSEAYNALYDYIDKNGKHYVADVDDSNMSVIGIDCNTTDDSMIYFIVDLDDKSEIDVQYTYNLKDMSIKQSFSFKPQESKIDVSLLSPMQVMGYMDDVDISKLTLYDVTEYKLTYFFAKSDEEREMYDTTFNYGFTRQLHFCNKALKNFGIGLDLNKLGFPNY